MKVRRLDDGGEGGAGRGGQRRGFVGVDEAVQSWVLEKPRVKWDGRPLIQLRGNTERSKVLCKRR